LKTLRPIYHVKAAIKKEADQCVKCGLCLPHCPTYQIEPVEGESPRGRIALAEGIAAGKLPLTDMAQTHLDQCLLCRQCEAVCPAGVKVGALMDNTRVLARSEGKHRPSLKTRVILKALALSKGGFRTRSTKQTHFAENSVQLFLGCVNELLDAKTLAATQTLLAACGYAVHIPKKQKCCGALHAHHGLAHQADTLGNQNQNAFSTDRPLVSLVTGCTAHLRNDPTLGKQVEDICAFLVERSALEGVHFAPLNAHILIHTPCSSGILPHHQDHVKHCVEQIPGVTVSSLPTQGMCCGGAGTYFLDHPNKSKALGEKSLDSMLAFLRGNAQGKAHPQYLVTTNIGCALQWRKHLSRKKLPISVVHPLFLLAKQLQNVKKPG